MNARRLVKAVLITAIPLCFSAGCAEIPVLNESPDTIPVVAAGSEPPAVPETAAAPGPAGDADPETGPEQAAPAVNALPDNTPEQAATGLQGSFAETLPVEPVDVQAGQDWAESVDVLCEQIGNKLGSVSIEDCLEQHFRFGGGFSVNQRPLVIKERHPATATSEAGSVNDDFRVLIMGGMHGDEYSSISILFKWMALFSPQATEGEFHWRFAPLVNPDGLLDGSQAKRQNANGVDLNRNFPSRDWNATAAQYWQDSTGSNPRRFPGKGPGSEPEVQWVVQQIEEFQPDVIVSVHAPYHLLDFDGPAEAPARIGELYLHQLGVYPGSLGNFAGLNRQIPVVTLELPSAGIMPPAEQISLMWKDLVAWLDREGRRGLSRL